MNKRGLTKAISKKTGYSQAVVGEILKATAECMKEELICGNDIILNRFGVFSQKVINERTVKHPVTGEQVISQKKIKVKFKGATNYLDPQ